MDVDTSSNPESPETVMLRRIQQLTEEPTMEGSTESHFIPVAELVKVLNGQVRAYQPGQPGQTMVRLYRARDGSVWVVVS
ncbi:hypothetical protein EV126DRAFT_407926 [Verticillium dahliae]|nr:hypothetical protein EV126DRAFT_407926 [Verticillium dahliae]